MVDLVSVLATISKRALCRVELGHLFQPEFLNAK